MFQSFFYWNWLSKGGCGSIFLLIISVSILLLLELAFEVQHYLEQGYSIRGFNPSSIGIGFRSINILKRNLWQNQVSILLLLELAFEVSIMNGTDTKLSGFNPSSIGIGFRSRAGLKFQNRRLMFQSFFYWNWLSKFLLDMERGLGIPVSILLLLELAFEAFFLALFQESSF